MKITVLQTNASLNASPDRFDRLEQHARSQAIAGAEVLVFPELYLSGYNVGDALHRKAEALKGPFASRTQSLARELGIAIVYGYPERDGDSVYNSAIFIDDSGQILANHRKTVLPDGIEPNWFEAGDGLTLFRFRGTTMALMICYECEFPETVRRAAAGGAEVVFVPTACGWEQVPNLVVPSRAYENGVFMVYANYGGVENGHAFAGLSCIVDPYGKDLARAEQPEEAISAKLDFGLVAEAHTRLPYLRDHQKTPSKLHLIEESNE